MWDIELACKKIMQDLIKQRNKAPNCELCNCTGFNPIQYLNEYLPYLEIEKKVITYSIYKAIYDYFWKNYPFHSDQGNLTRHHINYKKNVCVYVCDRCHGRIHQCDNSKYLKYKPVDKKPKRKKVDYKMFKLKKLM